MKTAHQILAVIVFLIVNVASVTRADNSDLKELLSGKRAPLALKLKDLDASWRRVRVSPSDAGAIPSMYAQLLGGGSAGVYYTKGEIVLVVGESYVIAYQHPVKTLDVMALYRGGNPPGLEPLTAESPLTLALIQLRTAGTLGDIRPFNLDQEIAEGAGIQKAVEGARDNSANNNSLNNLKQIGLGLMMYADDHDNKLPDLSDAPSLKKALASYLKDEKVFVQPRTGKPYLPNSSLSSKDQKGTNTANEVVVYEADPAEDGTRAVLFGDAHVERVDETRWLELKKTSNIP